MHGSTAWAAIEIDADRGHGMAPENRYGMRWAAWLGLVPYGIWSDSGVDHVERRVPRGRGPAGQRGAAARRCAHFGAALRLDGTSIDDLAVAVSTTIEGTWLTVVPHHRRPDRPHGYDRHHAGPQPRLLLRGATTA